MEATLSIILTIIAVIITARFVLKKFNPSLVFLVSGFIILTILAVWKGYTPLGDSTTGSKLLDVFAFAGDATKKQLSGVGSNLLLVAGYAVFMNHIGATDKLADTITKPLSRIKNPYIVMFLVFVIGACLKTMITSHIGLVLLLMSSVYPVLIKLGISPISAAATLLLTGFLDWGPNDGAVIFAAETVVGMPVVNYVKSYQVLPAIITILVTGIVMVIHFKREDEKGINIDIDRVEVTSEKLNSESLPRIYAFLPAIPLLLVVSFSFQKQVKMDVFTANVLGLIIAFIIEGIRTKNCEVIGEDLKVLFQAMGNSLANIVLLIISASIFAQGLIALGGFNILAEKLAEFKGAQLLTVIAFTALTFFGVIILGNGNATWFSFGPLAANLAPAIGLQAYQLGVPMQMSASIGRCLSPVAGAVLTTSGLSKITAEDLIKRVSVPIVAGALTNLIASYIIHVVL
ncbi:C4-dicarboxylate transporter DcuC [Tissierella praeacuta]|uniref:C4-dicarboxylate transporter DcuC n=1 Tax=Tissierella praeacuta TaxID=43131 RepID=UPI003342CBB5